MKVLNTAFLTISLVGLSANTALAAEVQTTADYLAISIEAEDFTNKDDRWVLTDANTQQLPLEEDPDPNHSGTASGGVYFELLPDIRVTHDDPQFPPVAFWGRAGTGPEMHWDVNIPEPGRYFVHARAYSTGTEDNGIHVGLNGEWPDSAETLQFCTAGARAWKWSSAQRDAGGVGSCGIQKTLYLDIENAGMNTIMVSAREDGFELDRLLLMKDLSGGTRTCTPTTATGISCRNGGIEMADGETDMAVSIVTDPVTIADGTDMMSAGNSFRISAIIENHDRFDDAENIVVSTDFAAGLRVRGVSPECSFEGQVVTCNLASQEPTAPGEFHKFDMAIDVVEGGSSVRPITAFVTNDLFEGNPDDNTFTVDVLVSDANDDLTTDIGVSLDTRRDFGVDNEMWAVGELGSITLDVFNTSDQASGVVDVQLQFTVGVAVDLMPAECSGTNPITCSYLSLDANESRELVFEINAASGGAQLITAITSVANDSNSANNRDSDVVIFESDASTVDVEEEEPVEEEPADVEEAVEETTDTDTDTEEDTAVTDETETTDTELLEEENDATEETDSDNGSDSDFTLPAIPNETESEELLEPTEPTTVLQSEQPVVDSNDSETEDVVTTVASRRSGGALSWKTLLMLMMLSLTCVYGRHKRQVVAVRQ